MGQRGQRTDDEPGIRSCSKLRQGAPGTFNRYYRIRNFSDVLTSKNDLSFLRSDNIGTAFSFATRYNERHNGDSQYGRCLGLYCQNLLWILPIETIDLTNLRCLLPLSSFFLSFYFILVSQFYSFFSPFFPFFSFFLRL